MAHYVARCAAKEKMKIGQRRRSFISPTENYEEKKNEIVAVLILIIEHVINLKVSHFRMMINLCKYSRGY